MHNLAKIRVPDSEEFKDMTINKSNRQLIVDKVTKLKMSKFFETKGGMIPYLAEFMHGKKEHGYLGYPVRILRQDNARENIAAIKRKRLENYFQSGIHCKKDSSAELGARDWIHNAGSTVRKHDECSTNSRSDEV